MKIRSATSIKGRREYMEDSASFIEHNGRSVVVVCDGHGGDSMSKKCSKELPVILVQTKPLENPIQTATDIRRSIMEFGEASKRTKSGTTVTGVVDDNEWIYIFNIGDSRTSVHLIPDGKVYHLKPVFGDGGKIEKSVVILYHTPFFTTADHDSNHEDEASRIELSSGILMGDRLNGILNVTRTLGDNGVGPGLDYTPDIYWIKRSDIVGPIFMYTDGVYETFKDDRSIEKKHMLYHMAEKWNTENLVQHMVNEGSSDNITAVLVDL